MENHREQGTCIHKTSNATGWMRNAITEYLMSKGFSIITFDISCEVMTRFEKTAVINTIALKFKDRHGNLHSLGNYSSINDDYDGENVGWLVDFIREKEREALTCQKPAERHTSVSYKVEGEKKVGKLRTEMYISSSAEEMQKFLTQREFMVLWAGPSAVVEDDAVRFENVVLRNIRASGQDVEMEYRWEDWKEFSHVRISFDSIGDVLKVTVTQSGIPVALIDNVKNHWRARIFQAISSIFGCAIKSTC